MAAAENPGFRPPERPRLGRCLRLRCPYCGQEPLRQKGSWFEFAGGCRRCRYRYEREHGYFTGASWMINFPVTGTLAFALTAFLVQLDTDLSSMWIAAIVSVFVFAFGLLFFPFSQALWIYLEHRFHPLGPADEWQPPATAQPDEPQESTT